MITNASGQQILQGDGTWTSTMTPFLDTADIVARDVQGTNWGDSKDTMDSGTTACGFSTKDHPGYLGVSLPLCHNTGSDAVVKALGGSPLPHGIPWYSDVEVYSRKTGKTAVGKLIDLGPAKWTGHAIDMTDGLVEALGLPLEDVYDVDFRIKGAAQYVQG